MSADNWTYCPKCIKELFPKEVPEITKVREVMTRSLREDYEFYMDNQGTLEIDYSCSCTECDFKFSYLKKVEALK